MKRWIWAWAALAVFAGAAPDSAGAADNLGVNSPTPGTATIKTDDVGGVHYQGYKLYDGEPDSSTYADVTAGNALKVDGSAVTQPVSGSVAVSGSVDTELPSAAALADAAANPTVTSAGVYIQFFNGTTWDRARGDTANGLDVDVTRLPALPAGTNNIGDVDVLTLPALPAGTNNIGDVDVLSLNDGGNSVTVDGTITANAGTGTFAVDSEFANQTDGAAAGTTGLQVLGTDGTNAQIIKTDTTGSVQVDCESGCGGGTQFAEDTAHVSGDQSTMAGVVQQSADAALSTDGDRSLLQVDSSGFLKVNIKAGAGSGGTAQADESAFTEGTTQFTPMGGVLNDTITSDPTEDQAAAARITAKRAVHINLRDAGGTEIGDSSANPVVVGDGGGTITVDGTVTANAGTGTFITDPTNAAASDLNAEVQGDAASGAAKSGNPVQVGGVFNTTQPTVTTGQIVEAQSTARGALIIAKGVDGFALDASTANIGDVDVLTLPALPAGTNNIGDVDVLSLPALPAGTNNIGDIDVLTLPNVAQATAANLNAEVQGDAAHDAAVSGNPVLLGAEARTSDETAVANGDVTRLQADLVGKLIVLPYAIPDDITQGCATATGTADTALEAAAGAGVRTYATSISVINTSATATYVTIKDGTTAIYEIPAPANNGGAVVPFPVPLRGTANTALNFASAAAVTTMRVCYNGYKSSN